MKPIYAGSTCSRYLTALRIHRLFAAAAISAIALLAAPTQSSIASTTVGYDVNAAPDSWQAGTVIAQRRNTDPSGTAYDGFASGGVITSLSIRTQGNSANIDVLILRKTAEPTASSATFLNVAPITTIPVTADPSGAGHITTVASRISVGAGDRFAMTTALTGTRYLRYHFAADADYCFYRAAPHGSGSSFTYSASSCNNYMPLVQGVVEADADADGYGDETQDQCPSQAAYQGPCPPSGAAYVGDEMLSSPTWVNAGSALTKMLNGDGSTNAGSPIAGVLTSVRLRSTGSAGTGKVHVLRNTGPLSVFPIGFLNVGPDIPFAATADATADGHYTEIATRQPIAVGDRLGISHSSPGMAVYRVATDAADCVFINTLPHAVGAVANYSNVGCNKFIPLVRGTVEPDADADGYGDVTQDSCSTDSTTQSACPPTPSGADLVVKIRKPAKAVKGKRAKVLITVTNNGPVTAEGVTLRIERSKRLRSVSFLGGACSSVRKPNTCVMVPVRLGLPVKLSARVIARSAGKLSLVVRVASSTADPVNTNNRSRITVKFAR